MCEKEKSSLPYNFRPGLKSKDLWLPLLKTSFLGHISSYSDLFCIDAKHRLQTKVTNLKCPNVCLSVHWITLQWEFRERERKWHYAFYNYILWKIEVLLKKFEFILGGYVDMVWQLSQYLYFEKTYIIYLLGWVLIVQNRKVNTKKIRIYSLT